MAYTKITYIGKADDGTRLYVMFPAEPAGLTADDLDWVREEYEYSISCCDEGEGDSSTPPADREGRSPCLDPEEGKLFVPRQGDFFSTWSGESWEIPVTPSFGGFKLSHGFGSKDIKGWFCRKYYTGEGCIDGPMTVQYTKTDATAGAGEGWADPNSDKITSEKEKWVSYDEDIWYLPPGEMETNFIHAPIPGHSERDQPWLSGAGGIFPWYRDLTTEAIEEPYYVIPYLIEATDTFKIHSNYWSPQTEGGEYYYDIPYNFHSGYHYKSLAYRIVNGSTTTERIDDVRYLPRMSAPSFMRVLVTDNTLNIEVAIHRGAAIVPLKSVISGKHYTVSSPTEIPCIIVIKEKEKGTDKFGWNPRWVLHVDKKELYLSKVKSPKAGCQSLVFKAIGTNPYPEYSQEWNQWWRDKAKLDEADNEDPGEVEPLVKCRKENGKFIADVYASPAYYKNAMSSYKLGENPTPPWFYTSNGVASGESDGTPVPYESSSLKIYVIDSTTGQKIPKTPTNKHPDEGRFFFNGPMPGRGDELKITYDRDLPPTVNLSAKYDCCREPEISWTEANGGAFPNGERKGYAIYEAEAIGGKTYRFFHRSSVEGGGHGWETSKNPYPELYFSSGWKFSDGYHNWAFKDFVLDDPEDGVGGLKFEYVNNEDNFGSERDDITLKCDMCCCSGCCNCEDTEFDQIMYNDYTLTQEFANFFPDFADYPSNKNSSVSGSFAPNEIGMNFRVSARKSDDSLVQVEFNGSLQTTGSCLHYGEWKSSDGKLGVICYVYREEDQWKFKARLCSFDSDENNFFSKAYSGGTLYEGTLTGLERFGNKLFSCAMDAPHVSHLIKEQIPKSEEAAKGLPIDIAIGNKSVVVPGVFDEPGSGRFIDPPDCCPDKSIPYPYPWLKPMTGRNTEVIGEYKKEGDHIHYCTCALLQFPELGSIKGFEILGKQFLSKVTYQDEALVYEIKLCGDRSYFEGRVKLWPTEVGDRSGLRSIMPIYEGVFGSGDEWFRTQHFIKRMEILIKQYEREDFYQTTSECNCEYGSMKSFLYSIMHSDYIFHGGQDTEHPYAYDTDDVDPNFWFGDAMSVKADCLYKKTISTDSWYPNAKYTHRGPVWSTVGVFGVGTYKFEYVGDPPADPDNYPNLILRYNGMEIGLQLSATIFISSGDGVLLARTNRLIVAETEDDETYYSGHSAEYYIYPLEAGPLTKHYRKVYDQNPAPNMHFNLVHPCGMATLGIRDSKPINDLHCRTITSINPTTDDHWGGQTNEGLYPFDSIDIQYADPLRIRLEDPDPHEVKPAPRLWNGLLNKDIYLDPETREDEEGFVYFVYQALDLDVGDKFTYTIQLGGVLEVEGIVYPRDIIHESWGLWEGEEYDDPEDWFYGFGPVPVRFEDDYYGRAGIMRKMSSLHILGYIDGELSFYSYGKVLTENVMYFARRFPDKSSEWAVAVDNAMVLGVSGGFTILYKHPGTIT